MLKPGDRLSVAIATGGYLSYIAVGAVGLRKWSGAGFLGTVEGLLLSPLVPRGQAAAALFVAASAALACWICGRAQRSLGDDDPRIILDEIVGFWSAAALLPRTWTALLAAFVVFRVLDSVKIPPFNWLERLPGGLGVVADDVGAGLAAGLLVRAFT